ncbi:tyrosine-type recombinase/integrase [Nonomuraea sp. NPDC049141]|uniref:tyrosine-type recombinase/integrase n=1 Tax=Nonomuraea sp. NPDC049141 TaxID=3155500 RepID=UPI0033D002D7
MTLAAVRSLSSPRRLRTAQEIEDFEQELVDQFLLAEVGAGISDGVLAADRSVLVEFVRGFGQPIWTADPEAADAFLVGQRRVGLARSTIYRKAVTIGQFFDFLIARYQVDIHRLTGHVVVQPIDEFNRPPKADYGAPRVPPSTAEVEALFAAWRESLPHARKYLPAARDYLAASLWRRAGLRITETVMLDIRDWRPDLGPSGKLHVRFGKGSRGRGPKTRLVSAINEVDALLEWWLNDVRHQFGDDWDDPDAPLLPSERRDPQTGRCRRAGDDALRSGLAGPVARYLPAWAGRLTPHGLRHYCASSLYERGPDLKAIQEQLGHEWLSTTTRYIHVHDDHVERAWSSANARVAARLEAEER